MIRIVGLQRSENPEREFVLLQNQGAMRLSLRGHAIMGESVVEDSYGPASYVFSEPELIPAGMYVILVTGQGSPRWGKTKDGQMIYHVYMNRCGSVWRDQEGPLHILNIQHSYTSRSFASVV